MIRSAAAIFAGLVATGAFAADLGVRNPVPVAAPVSASCKETEASGLPNDAFGFSSGTDVSDLGAYSASLEYNGNFKGFGFKPGNFSGHLGKVQFSTSFLPCWEIGPYLLGQRGFGTDRFAFGTARVDQYGGGVENKYKILGRASHGIGLTLISDVNYQGYDARDSRGLPTLSWSGKQFSSTYKLLLDKELIASKLFAAINLQLDQTWTELPGFGIVPDTWLRLSNLTLSAGLTYQVIDGVFLGGEARYIRTHNGAFLNRFTGDAVYIGPTAFWQVTKAVSLSGTWGVQVTGNAKFPALAAPTPPQSSSELNLITQNQHIAKAKLAISF